MIYLNSWTIYRKLRHKCTNVSRATKKRYFTDKINANSGNSKDMWSVLKNLLPNKPAVGISSLDIGGKLITVAKDIANEFNNFFINVGDTLSASLNAPKMSHLDYLNKLGLNPTHFNFSDVTGTEVLKHLSQLKVNKATGLDNIQSRLLETGAPAISNSIAFLFNMSLRTGDIPADWKSARISAVFKKGSKQDVGNYRPISILPVISKILEKVVHSQAYAHLTAFDLLAHQQSGFRKHHSTQTSLHFILEDFYKGLYDGHFIGMIALDLRKAFDTVNHSILLDKLSHYGFNGVSHDWFSSYLKDRKQIAYINGSFSEPRILSTGVPQGSILGPLLYVIYVNDLYVSLLHCKVNMYADDTAIYFSSATVAEISASLQVDLLNISDWLNTNKLCLHIGKTNSMLVCTKQRSKSIDMPLDVSLQDQPVSQVDCCNYLGVTIDHNLSFDNHMDIVIKKISKSLGILKRVSQFVPLQSRITLYNTIVLPHFDYCTTIWDMSSSKQINRLQILQNRGMKIVLQCHRRTHICDRLSKLKWLNVRQRLFYLKSIFMYKIVNKLTPLYLSNMATPVTHSHNTRSKDTNSLARCLCHPKSIMFSGFQLWNSLPTNLKTTPSINVFKKHCIKYILGQNCKI